MRLATLSIGDTTAAAIVLGDGTARVLGSRSNPAFADVGAVIRSGALDGGLDELAAGPGEEISFKDAELLAPVLEPGAVFCVGLNYRSHILEMGRDLPPAPTIFDKLPRALTAPYADVVVPTIASERLDYEGELCVVIGGGGRDIPESEALDAVAGYSVFNDVTMRDYQTRSMQWFAGKSWQDASPWGPTLVTRDDFEGSDHELTVTVNGDVRQRAETSDLVFDVARLVSDLSTIVELYPGDLIATGTPGGVGEAMNPKGYLQDGDVVEVTITGLGSLRNTVRVK
ncbi:fumarylacetoacetate hydrolase family protein [Streptomyces sp. NPDC096311]|uniref:fumarylacetoacetate hydrolase family protein n=1 Tax=Streptomyces sp. NPDC096311 TaxID=3366083 RepID=UPI0038226AEF